ncbi:MAG: FxLYD domain-containing protein [Dehalococcoidia bacterium]
MIRKARFLLPAILLLGVLATGCTLLITFTKIGNTYYFAGVIKNGTPFEAHGNNVSTQFLNASNETVGSLGTVSACKRVWEAGEDNYFEASTTNSTYKKVIAKLKSDSTFGFGSATGDLAISNVSVFRDEDELTVEGTVKNNDNDEIESVRVCIVIRNEDDDIVRVVIESLSPDDLDEDEDGDFSFSGIAVLDDIDDIATVDIYVDGFVGDIPIVAEEDLNNDVDLCPDATNTPTPVTNTPTVTSTPDPTITPGTNTPTRTPIPGC